MTQGKMTSDPSNTFTLQEIDSVNDLLQSIAGMFETYYNLVPKTDELTKDKELAEEKEKKSLDLWDKTLNALKFYTKIRDFVKTIVNKR